ncbi:MAG: Anhydrotetracycline monooxygenase [Gemmatimonadaceae bacterium]|nr:Anhydrotetracycline monooxygenase [Gemmatimonadaceae bacterium]
MTGLGVRYDLGNGHPLIGARMPDLDLVVADRSVRMFELLRDARPIVITFGEPGGVDQARLGERVPVIAATCDGKWELPAIGFVDPPTALFVRPDGYVAAVDGSFQELLTQWR